MTTSLNKQPDDLKLPAGLALSEELEAELLATGWRLVLTGISDAEEFTDYLDMDETDLDTHALESVFEVILEARRKQLAELGAQGIQGNINQAFAELNAQGIIARANFSCCGTCADGEIWDERTEDSQPKGYIYFHQQDTESLMESRETYIGYGVFLDAYLSEEDWDAKDDATRSEYYDSTVRELMHGEVFPTLGKYGIEPSWDDTLETRILLSNADFIESV